MRLLKAPQVDSTPRNRRVMAICGDTQVGLWMVRSLGRNGLRVLSVCRSPQGLAAHSRYSAGAWMLESSLGSDGFAAEVEQLAHEQDVGSIITISEGYHNALIRLRDRFEPDIRVLSPSRDCFDKATNKDYMHSLCVELGIPVARGMTLEKLMKDNGDELAFPLVLRTSRQNSVGLARMAPWKAAYVTDKEQLNDIYESVKHIADNVIVQEYHPGVEDHVQILMHRGEAFMAGEYIGEHHMPLAGGVTVQRVSCRHDGLIANAVQLLKRIEWDGIAGVQFHYDPETDRYIFLEINPRFIGGLPTVIMAGFEAPFLLWQSHFEPDKMKVPQYRLGLRTRVLGGDANWMLGMMRGDELPPGQKKLSKLSAAGRFLWNCGPWTRDDAFLPGDMKPAFVDLRQMIRHLRERSVDLIDNPQNNEDQR